MGAPLAGVRVLAVEQYGAGPFGTMFLADQGAEVVKIEHPCGGDTARGVGPYFFQPGDSLFFHSFNRNKRSLTLDLRRPEGRAVFRDLAAEADAVACNLRGDVPDKLGLTYESLKTANRAIVCAHLTAYGRTGPRRAWPGYDYLMQAEAGWFALTGEPGSAPARCGLSVVDMMTGLALAFALLAALCAARATGEGRDIDVSLFDVALGNLGYLAAWYLNEGAAEARRPRSAHPSLVPCQSVRTADGWIFVMCNKEKFWPALCRAVGRPEWIDDARFADFAARLAHRAVLSDLLDSALAARTTADWLARFAGIVPAAPINDVAQALDNPFVAGRGLVETLEHASAGAYRMLAAPVRGGAPGPSRPAPALGADTDSILAGLGYGAERIAALRKAGVV